MWNNFINYYWQTERVKLYCGDALEVLKTFPNESIDMVMTSSPFFQNWTLINGVALIRNLQEIAIPRIEKEISLF